MTRSKKEKIILDILKKGENYGIDIVEKSQGRLKRGLIYIILGDMEECGIIKSRKVNVKGPSHILPRRMYSI